MDKKGKGIDNTIIELMNRISLPLILLMGFIVRIPGIVSRPIWYDEAFSILFSEKGLKAMLYGTLTSTGAGTADIHPLGYYGLLWGWMKLFGESLFAVRMMSIIVGVGTIGLAYLIAQELFSKRIAVLGGLFVAFAPFQVHYSQEIRMYALLAFWLILATYAFIRATRVREGKKWWLIFAFACAFAQYTHNLAAFYLIPLAITPILRKDWRSLFAVTLSGLGAILLYLPWLLFVPGQFTKISTSYWVVRPGFEKFFTLLLVYVTNLPLPGSLLFIGLFISLALVCIAFIQTFMRSNRNSYLRWLLYLSFIPPIFLFLFSQWVPVYIERVLLPSGVIFCIWLAGSLFDTSLNKFILALLMVMLIFGAGIGYFQHITYHGFPYAPFRELDASLQDNFVDGDVIIHSNKLSMLPAVYFDRDLDQVFIVDPPGSGGDTLAPATLQVLGLVSQTDIKTAIGNADRAWFIIYDQSNQEFIEAGQQMQPDLSWLTKNYSLVEIKKFGDLQVYLFSG